MTISIVFQLLGCTGMLLFPMKFSFATDLDAHQVSGERFVGLNGYQFWCLSWGWLILGTLAQLFE
jgi:hypothetical protein